MPGLFEYHRADATAVYRNLQNPRSETLAAIRRQIDEMWPRYETLADQHFVRQFSISTEERFFEMYLGCTFLDLGCRVSSSNQGPDFCVEIDDSKIWIEAVTVSRGAPDNPDYVPEPVGNNQVSEVPVDKIILRLTSVIEDKRKKLAKLRDDNWFGENDRIVIAVSGALLQPYARGVGDSVPYIVKAVYPIGNQYVVFDRSGGDVGSVESGHHHRPTITRESGSEISTASFLGEACKFVGAVLFAPNGIGNIPDLFGEDLIAVHNIRCRNSVPRKILGRGTDYWLEENETEYEVKSESMTDR